MNSGRILGVDYGRKKVGIAISNPDQTIAFPREILHLEGLEEAAQKVEEFARLEKVKKIVVGIPLSLKGESTEQTKQTHEFIECLKTKTSIKIEPMDERLTSVQAQKTGGQDDVAAQILLQTYLDKSGKMKA